MRGREGTGWITLHRGDPNDIGRAEPGAGCGAFHRWLCGGMAKVEVGKGQGCPGIFHTMGALVR